MVQNLPLLAVDGLAWLLTVSFLVIGGTKLLGLTFQRNAFDLLGYPQGLRLVVGACEVAGAFLLHVPGLRAVGAAALVVITSGAVHAHVVRERAPAHAVPPAVLGAVAFAVALVAGAG